MMNPDHDVDSILPANTIDLRGKRFERLTVVGHAGSNASGALWLCVCECGKNSIVSSCNLKSGDTKSCGCFASQLTSERNRTHGLSHTPEHNIWKAILRRCTNRACREYARYGGRGIAVCERWATSFANFYADMGPRPSTHHSIDRIDNQGPYSPDNCRWATPAEQTRNKSNNRWLTCSGTTLTMTDWACRVGISVGTLYSRLERGWDDERAIMEPIRNRKGKGNE